MRLAELRELLALERGIDAVDDAAALASEQPDNVDVLVVLAQARLAAGDPGKALEVLKTARQRAPQRPDLLKLEGDIAAGMRNWTAAGTAYEGALELDPRLVQVRLELGKVHEAREDWAAAEASYQAALDQLPTFFEAAVALAELHRRTGAPRKAIHLLAEVLTADSAALDALLVLGKALLDDGRVDEALHSFERVLSHEQHHLPALFFSGVVFARQRRYQQAVERWDRVIDLDPSGPYAHRARKHARTALDLRHIFQSEVA